MRVFRESFASTSPLPNWIVFSDGCGLVAGSYSSLCWLLCTSVSGIVIFFFLLQFTLFCPSLGLLHRKLLHPLPWLIPQLSRVGLNLELSGHMGSRAICLSGRAQVGDSHSDLECTLPFPANPKPLYPPGGFERLPQASVLLCRSLVATSPCEYPSATLLLGFHSSLEKWSRPCPSGEAGTSESPDAFPTSLQIMESHFRWGEVGRGLGRTVCTQVVAL